MTAIDDGGPAFPMATVDGYAQHGMTLRDYFAARVMQALIAHHGFYDDEQPIAAMTSATALDYHSSSIAKASYAYADEMLKAREP